MPEKSLTTEQVLALLAETPSRIAAFTAGLPPEQLRTSPNESEWSANDVLAHLRSCADVWGNCIATIIAEDMPTIRAINPRTWVKSTGQPAQAGFVRVAREFIRRAESPGRRSPDSVHTAQ